MRPLVFHLADNAMVEGLKAFFRRENWHFALGCSHFDIDPESERDFLKIGGENDPQLWKSAEEHLAPYLATHERAIILLDESFGGSPGAAQIRVDIIGRMVGAGWDAARFEVIVIQPMLESWLWIDSDHVARAFGCGNYAGLRDQLIAEGMWDTGQPKPKPAELKNARDRAARLGKSKSGRAAFRNVFAAVSSRALNRCHEPGFQQFRAILKTWFPPQPETWAK